MDMIRVSETVSVSLPPEMVDELERARKDEHRTRSEFVREALRQYMGWGAKLRQIRRKIAELPDEEPTAGEIEAIEESRRAFQEGSFITLEKFRHAMGPRSQQPRRKRSLARSRR
jgi:metal-responsive CopG/Arc/MetJ family transcriptional regulator